MAQYANRAAMSLVPSSCRSKCLVAHCTSSPESSLTLLTHCVKTEFLIHLSPVVLSVANPVSLVAQTTNPEAVLSSSLSTSPIYGQLPSLVNFASYRFPQSLHIHSSPASLLPWFRCLVSGHVKGGAFRWRCSEPLTLSLYP